VKPDEDGHDQEKVARTRLAELEEACRHLDVSDLELLGYHDSGMPEWRFKDLPDSFCNVPLDEGASRLVELFEKYQPDVVITYDELAGYNHPDHLQANRITVAAVERSGIPAKLYLIARRRRDFEKIRERMAESGFPVPPAPQIDAERLEAMRKSEERITTTVDTSAFTDRKRDALVTHASQLDESWFGRLPPELFAEVFGHESFIRAQDRTGAELPEDDLFAGLR
jgi:LmbE family N-acetylglucosaminyl deacetylase